MFLKRFEYMRTRYQMLRVRRAPLLLCGLLLLMLSRPGTGQGVSGDARERLNRIRSEISQLQRELQQSRSTLQGHLESMKNLDQQTTLQQKALRILRNEIGRGKNEISRLAVEIDTLTQQIESLQDIFRRQIRFTYKYQRGHHLEWLLGSANFNQALIRYRYFQSISAGARRVYRRLRDKQTRLAGLKSRRNTELQRQQTLAENRSAENEALEQKRGERQRLVDQISRNNNLLQAAIQEKQASYEKLQHLIGSLEKQKEERVANIPDPVQWDKIKGNFAAQRRKLNWPVRGNVVHTFGRYKNPRLKTVLVNNGVDIKAAKGARVYCVFSGVVSVITYLGGYGNTVIVDHNKGYYTVYAHLDEVLVEKYQVLDAGTIVGTVGTSGSLEGELLHFELYGGNKALDPLQWLRRE